MHPIVARGTGVLALLVGMGTLTVDVLDWAGVGPDVRLDQHAVMVGATIILTVVWATGVIVRAEHRPAIKELARQRGAVRDIESTTTEALTLLRREVARLAGPASANGLDPEMIDAARRIARRLLDQN